MKKQEETNIDALTGKEYIVDDEGNFVDWE